MNISVHVISSGIVSILLAKFIGGVNSFSFFLFSIIPDVDHFLDYMFRFQSVNIKDAYNHYNSKKHVPRHSLCAFHTIEVAVVFGIITLLLRNIIVTAAFCGFLMHMAIDVAQAIYYRRLDYRWWSFIQYWRVIKRKSDREE